jgi:hypothetical protein
MSSTHRVRDGASQSQPLPSASVGRLVAVMLACAITGCACSQSPTSARQPSIATSPMSATAVMVQPPADEPHQNDGAGRAQPIDDTMAASDGPGVEVITVSITVHRGGHHVEMMSEQRCPTPAGPCATFIAPLSIDGVTDPSTSRDLQGPPSALAAKITQTLGAQRDSASSQPWTTPLPSSVARDIFANTTAASVLDLDGPVTAVATGEGAQWMSLSMSAPQSGWALVITRRVDPQ